MNFPLDCQVTLNQQRKKSKLQPKHCKLWNWSIYSRYNPHIHLILLKYTQTESETLFREGKTRAENRIWRIELNPIGCRANTRCSSYNWKILGEAFVNAVFLKHYVCLSMCMWVCELLSYIFLSSHVLCDNLCVSIGCDRQITEHHKGQLAAKQGKLNRWAGHEPEHMRSIVCVYSSVNCFRRTVGEDDFHCNIDLVRDRRLVSLTSLSHMRKWKHPWGDLKRYSSVI